MKVDILAFGAHPDDVEISCSGSLLASAAGGSTFAIVDLSPGELGSRGTTELREQEAAASAKILGAAARVNLGLADGFIRNDETSQMEVIRMIRRYQPRIVLAPAPHDRHPDHGESSRLIRDSAFKSGLGKLITQDEGKIQSPWRPLRVFHYIQDKLMNPDFVVDISPFFLKKVEAVKAFRSQFHDPESKEPVTYISTSEYWKFLEARAREMGHLIGVEFGEGFLSDGPVGVKRLKSKF